MKRLLRSLAVLVFPFAPANAAELRIRVTDESGQAIWSRLEVHGPDGKMYQAEGTIHSALPGRSTAQSPFWGSFVAEGECRLDLPPGSYRVVAEHGLEYERFEQTAEVPADLRIRLKPWTRMWKNGWWSGDMHVHRPVEQLKGLALAEDLNLGVAFTMWNRQNLWSDKPYPSDPEIRAGDRHRMTITNAEDERGGGAWMLHGLKAPLGLETIVPEGKQVTASWFPPGLDYVRKARTQGGVWFDSEKPIWWETPVMMVVEPPDSIGLLHNHYDQYTMMDSEAWGRARDHSRYPGLRGFSDYSLQLIYRYWNLGFRTPPSAGSASGVLPNPVGYNRLYAHLDGAFTVAKWYEAVRAGRLFVTNGPMLLWKPRVVSGRLEADLEASAREEIDRLELVANGKVVWSVAGKGRSYRGKASLPVAGHSWVAARCMLKTAFTVRMAHTAPLWLQGAWDAREDAAYFLEWIGELIANSEDAERKRLLPHYEKAREFYAGKAR
jgi:hypothetical protein